MEAPSSQVFLIQWNLFQSTPPTSRARLNSNPRRFQPSTPLQWRILPQMGLAAASTAAMGQHPPFHFPWCFKLFFRSKERWRLAALHWLQSTQQDHCQIQVPSSPPSSPGTTSWSSRVHCWTSAAHTTSSGYVRGTSEIPPSWTYWTLQIPCHAVWFGQHTLRIPGLHVRGAPGVPTLPVFLWLSD